MKYKITVIIVDTTPVIHLNSAATHRTVTIELTEEQSNKLKLCTKDEMLNMCILEEIKED